MTDFVIGKFAELPKPTPRVRQDWRHVELERSRPIEPLWKRYLHWFGVISFFAIALVMAVH